MGETACVQVTVRKSAVKRHAVVPIAALLCERGGRGSGGGG